MTRPLDRRLSVAPMMDWTDRHERVFLRCLTGQTLLYTEMVVTGAILFGKSGPGRFLDYNKIEEPVALQLGGSDPDQLAQSAKMGADWGYQEINLNCGCPSDKVSAGRFGACLMAEPDLVADCMSAMREAVDIPVTIKHRIGIDDLDSYELLCRFVEKVAATGTQTFIVHARKAWLNGLSPKENREIPPLSHHVVHQLKQDFPQLEIILNGGIQSIAEASSHLDKVDGVMIGRAAYETPYIMSEADRMIFGASSPLRSPFEVLEDYIPYVDSEIEKGTYLRHMARHIMGLFHGMPGARAWRRHLGEHMFKTDATSQVLRDAASRVQDALAA